MDKLNFQDGTLVSPAKVTIDNVEHTVTPAVYSGSTPLSAYALNQLQNNVEKVVNTQNVTTSNTDLNDYTTEGRYFFETNVTPQNVPTGVVNGWLEVFSKENWIKQVWYRAGTPNVNDHETYVRTTTGDGTWSDWKRFTVDKDDLLIYKGVVPVDDLNDLKDPGIYYTANKELINAGTSYMYGYIIVIGNSTRTYIIQQLIKPFDGTMKTREYSGEPRTWKNWNSYMVKEEKFFHNGNLSSTNSKTFNLEPLKNYLLVATSYGQGNVLSKFAGYIVTTGLNAQKNSSVLKAFGNNDELITTKFIDGLTLKVTSSDNIWNVLSFTEL